MGSHTILAYIARICLPMSCVALTGSFATSRRGGSGAGISSSRRENSSDATRRCGMIKAKLCENFDRASIGTNPYSIRGPAKRGYYESKRRRRRMVPAWNYLTENAFAYRCSLADIMEPAREE